MTAILFNRSIKTVLRIKHVWHHMTFIYTQEKTNLYIYKYIEEIT